MISYGIVIAWVLFVAIIAACNPYILANNEFINGFVGGDLLNLLAVIMTITFASIANLHLTISRLIGANFKENIADGQKKAAALRGQLNTNAWLLFWVFALAVLCSIAKGMSAKYPALLAIFNGGALGALLVQVLVFHDIYSTLFGIASSDLAVRGEAHAVEEP